MKTLPTEESRFLSREEDPMGEWESSPDGESLLIFKVPGVPTWVRWAKRLVKKFSLNFREAFRFSSWAFQVQGELPEDVKSYWEFRIGSSCPKCGGQRIPARLFGRTPYCPSCGCRREGHGFTHVARELRKLLISLLPIRGQDEPIGEKGTQNVPLWVPIPLEPEEPEEEKPQESYYLRLWWESEIQRTNVLHKLRRLKKELYERGKSLSYHDRCALWSEVKSKEQTLSFWREAASRKLVPLIQDALSKTLHGQGSKERVNDWVKKLPLSEEGREWVKDQLLENLRCAKLRRT
jgi:hypothetical protein